MRGKTWAVAGSQAALFEGGNAMRIASTKSKASGARPCRFIARFFLSLLALLVLFLATSVPVPAETSRSLEAEIERLKIIVEVKQQKIEALERQLQALRAQLKARRDREIVAQIQSQVEKLRRLRAKRPVMMEPLTAENLDALLEREIYERFSQEQFRGYEKLLKHLGLIPEKMDLRRFLGALMAEQVAGLYDDQTKKLYVSDRFDLEDTITRAILAHEICHALQDQNFDLLSSPIHDNSNDDRAVAALSVIEGDAMMLLSEYMGENLSWRILLELPKFLMMDQSHYAAAPRFLSQSLVFPYMQGMRFITECQLEWRLFGPGARDRLLRDFPRSTEQILHPRKYLGPGRDEPTEISLDRLTSAGLVPRCDQYSNVVGESAIRMMLSEHLPAGQAEAAAAGWDGDRLVFGGSLEGEYAMAWLSVWDTRGDAVEFAEALARYFKAQRSDLAEPAEGAPARGVWLSDKRGWVAVADRGRTVACAHSRRREMCERIMGELLSLAAEIRIVP